MIARVLAAVPVLAAAAVLFASSFWLFPAAGVSAYSQTVQTVSADDVPADAHVTPYGSLSDPGQRVIDDGPGDVTVRGDRPDVFQYTDAPRIDRGIHYVRQNETYYEVRTHPGGFDGDGILRGLFQGTAVFLGIVGGVLSYYRRPRAAVGLGTTTLAVLGIGVYTPSLLVPAGWEPWLYVLFVIWLLIAVFVGYVSWKE